MSLVRVLRVRAARIVAGCTGYFDGMMMLYMTKPPLAQLTNRELGTYLGGR